MDARPNARVNFFFLFTSSLFSKNWEQPAKMSELQAKVWPLMVQRTMGSGGSWAKWIYTWIRNIFIDYRKWRCIRLTYLHSVSFGYPSYPPGFVKFPFASDSLISSFPHVPGVEKARFFKKNISYPKMHTWSSFHATLLQSSRRMRQPH